jgi:VCBS repeat-containing protein
VTVAAVNDIPVITSGSSGTVAENAATTTVIYTASVTDADAGDTRTYSLKAATGDVSLLNINATTGAVTLNASADYETKSSYTFTVMATDSGGLSAEQAVTVAVTNVNEAPVFTTTNLSTTYTDTSATDTFSNSTGTFSASDVDASTTLTYGISGGSGTTTITKAGTYGTLSIDSATGAYTYAPNPTIYSSLVGGNGSGYLTTAPTLIPGISTTSVNNLAINYAETGGAPIYEVPASAIKLNGTNNQYIIYRVDDYLKMIRIELSVDASNNVYARAVDAKYTHLYHFNGDVNSAWQANTTIAQTLNTSSDSFGGYGVRAIQLKTINTINETCTNTSESFTVTANDSFNTTNTNFTVNLQGVNETNELATTYNNTTVSQIIKLNASQKVNGTFTFSIQARDGGYPSGDSANLEISYYNSSNILLGTASVQNNATPSEAYFTKYTLSSSTNTGRTPADIDYIKVSFKGHDQGYKAGSYGTRFKDPILTFTETGGVGSSNLLYNPGFGTVDGLTAKGWTSSRGYYPQFANNLGMYVIEYLPTDYASVNTAGGGYFSGSGFQRMGEVYGGTVTGTPGGYPQISLNTPLVLDLNHDGVRTLGTEVGVQYDLTGLGRLASVGWSSPEDGFLVRDLNDDGLINDGTEMFGEATVLANGERAQDGFEALSDLDTNQDGLIDSQDQVFNSLAIWRDANTDGLTDAGELLTLAQNDITSLNLSYAESDRVDNGNQLRLVSNFTKTDGSQHELVDVWLATFHENLSEAEMESALDAYVGTPEQTDKDASVSMISSSNEGAEADQSTIAMISAYNTTYEEDLINLESYKT